MSSTMLGVRGRTTSRVNAARVDATRLAYIPLDTNSTPNSAWTQVRGPEAIEPANLGGNNWTEVKR